MPEVFLAMPLVLADQIGQYITLAVLVLTFLSWFVKLIKGQDGAAAGAPPARRPAEKELRTEIEVFLQELTKSQPEAVRKPEPPPRRPPAPPKPKADRPRKARPAEPVAKAAVKPAERGRPGSRLAQRHLAPTPLGQGVRAHLTEYMASDRVTAESQQHIGHRIDAAVQQDLGAMAAIAAAAPNVRSGAPGNPWMAIFSQPGGMRQAFVLNEILQKPAALRRKASHP